MNKITVAFLCLGVMVISGFGQTNRTTRPRVAPTPSQAPSIQNDPQITPQRQAPTLQGNRPGQVNRAPAAAVTPTPVPGEDEVVKVETNLVTMPVSVIDRDGRFVSGLSQRDFRIYENGVEQRIGYFQSVEQPFTVVLMIDVSPSTQYRIDEIHAAAVAFVDQLRQNDKVMVIAFDQRVQILSEPTNNRARLRNAIYQAQFGDGTSIYEAVDHVINRELKRIPGRKAVVLFTDGVDTTSRRASFDSTVADVEEIDALFYPIRYNTQPQYGYGGGGGYPRRGGGGGRGAGDIDSIIGIILGGGQIRLGGRGPAGSSPGEYETGKRYLTAIANNSGGRQFEADNLYNLEAAFSGIAEELRRQYSLGYYPEKEGTPGERRQIRIRVERPNLVVRAKNSYIVGQTGNPAGR